MLVQCSLIREVLECCGELNHCGVLVQGCGLGASNFDNDVEGHILTCEQKLMPPEGAISEALHVLPDGPVNSRKILADIHPLHNNMVGYIQTEPLTPIPNQKQSWATDQRYEVYNAPFTEEVRIHCKLFLRLAIASLIVHVFRGMDGTLAKYGLEECKVCKSTR